MGSEKSPGEGAADQLGRRGIRETVLLLKRCVRIHQEHEDSEGGKACLAEGRIGDDTWMLGKYSEAHGNAESYS